MTTYEDERGWRPFKDLADAELEKIAKSRDWKAVEL